MKKHLFALLLLSGLPFAVSGASAADIPTLTISVYGIAQDGYRKDVYAPFEVMCGCKLVIDSGNSSERLAKLEARKDNPEVDVAALADFSALEAEKKGLIQPIDVTKLHNYDALYDFAKDPIGGHLAVGYTFYSTSIAYRTDKVKVTSWKDLFKPELKGRIALPNITTTQGPLMLLMVDRAFGGTTPDFATGIGKVAAAKGDILTFYERSPQLNQLFQQDEIWAGVLGRFGWSSMRKLGMPIAWATPQEGQTGGMNVLTLVKGSKNQELALKFIDFWLSEDIQKAIATDRIDSPANAKVTVPADVAEDITYGAETAKVLHFIPPQTVLENRDAWLAGWNAKIAN